MALGTQFDLEIHRGDDRQITATVVDEAGVVVDITGAAITYVIVTQDADAAEPQPKRGATPVVTKTVGSGIVITDAVNGAIRIDLGSGDTDGQKAPTTFYHEIQIQLGGFATTVMFGNLTIKRDAIAPGP